MNFLHRYLKLTLKVTFLFIFSSCIHLDETVYLNPDGTVKIEVKARDYDLFGKSKNSTDEELKKFALTKIKLVLKYAEAVTNVSYSDADGAYKKLNYTAYYPSIQLYNNSTLSKDLFETDMKMSSENTLGFEVENLQGVASFSKSVEHRELDENELKELVKKQIAANQQQEKMLTMVFKDFYIKKTFCYNGSIVSSNNIETETPNKLILEFDGEKLYEILREAGKDEKLVEIEVKEKYGMQVERSSTSIISQKVYGNTDPVNFELKFADKPTFKYEKEVKSAKGKMGNLLRELGEEYYENKVYQIKDEEGVLKEEGAFEFGLKNGVWKEYYSNGNIKSERSYVKGKENGIKKKWHMDGKIKQLDSLIVNGKVTGKTTKWYKNGQIKQEEFKVDGQGHGLTRGWYDNGQLNWEYNKKEGQRDGIYKTWYENGKIEREEKYIDGYPDGELKLWSNAGVLIELANYKDRKQFGVFKVWYDNGIKREESNYINDNIKDGISKEWSSDAKDSMQVVYKDGEIWEGTHKYWYYEKLQTEVNYKEGKKHGISRHWKNFGGELEREEIWEYDVLKETKIYENGKLIKKE